METLKGGFPLGKEERKKVKAQSKGARHKNPVTWFSPPRPPEKRQERSANDKIPPKKHYKLTQLQEPSEIRRFVIGIDLNEISESGRKLNPSQIVELIWRLVEKIRNLELELNKNQQALIEHGDNEEMHMVERRAQAGVFEQNQAMQNDI